MYGGVIKYMNQLSFMDKISVLFKLLFSSPIIIGIFVFSFFLMILLFFNSRFNKKVIKYSFVVIYVLILGFSIFKYGNYFLTSIDSFLTLFMANIYFPIIPVYVVIMVISFIIMIFTLGGRVKSKVVKVINTVFFTLIQMMFAIFIYIIESTHMDLSANANLYSNEQTMTLLELGMGLFFIWIIILLVVLYLKKADKIFKLKSDDVSDDFDEYINDYNEPNSVLVNNNSSSNVLENTSFNDSSINLNNSVDFGNIDLDSSVNSSLNNSNGSDYDIVKSLVPEATSISSNVQGVNNSTMNTNINMNSSSIFDNFQFLDIPNKNVERKEDEVEIIDL
jgi:hypothetical protein